MVVLDRSSIWAFQSRESVHNISFSSPPIDSGHYAEIPNAKSPIPDLLFPPPLLLPLPIPKLLEHGLAGSQKTPF